MATRSESLPAGGPESPARPFGVWRASVRRRVLVDRWASRLVILGGLIIIASILAILVVIAGGVYPLLQDPTIALVGTHALGGQPAPGESLGVDEYREVAYVVGADGAVRLLGLDGDRVLAPVAAVDLGAARVTTVTRLAPGQHLLGTSDGRVIPLDVAVDVEFEGDVRTVTPRPVFGKPVVVDPERGRPVQRAAAAQGSSGVLTIAQVGPTELRVHAVVEERGLIGPTRRTETLGAVVLADHGEITALRIDQRGEQLFVGTSRGAIVRYDLGDPGAPARIESIGATPSGAPISVLGFLIGDRTLVIGDGNGQVSTWQVVPPAEGGAPRLTRIHEFAPHRGRVVATSPSRRDKGFITGDATGEVFVRYGTSGETLLRVSAPDRGDVSSVVFAPKADGLLAVDGAGRVAHWQLRNPHPEVTLHALFGEVWYEGYAEPAYVWQSTGGTDDFEAKLSLMPLVFGTLKGTLYALLIAVPIALLAALYVSEFMHASIKAWVKPVVEIMAALPSVVLGFLAGLWLAPIVEQIVPGIFVLPLVMTTVILIALAAWRAVPVRIRGLLRPGTEVVVLLPVVVLAMWLALELGGFVEGALLGGDYRQWLLARLGLTYDQRNSLVVGIAMGFAVIPIIFTIAEDSLANVPQHLRAGSLALGATRWQTGLRVVLPTASPGIFSAVMIGFGRAVGETMIVLMATGNTPVMDWSIFSGFRALSANIAVELPEAPQGGTLYRVLFLAALLLFGMTFLVNTAAEIVRLRLRRKYRYL